MTINIQKGMDEDDSLSAARIATHSLCQSHKLGFSQLPSSLSVNSNHFLNIMVSVVAKKTNGNAFFAAARESDAALWLYDFGDLRLLGEDRKWKIKLF